MQRPPILDALFLQLVAVLTFFLLARYASLGLPLWGISIGVGVLATVLSYLTKLPRWWLPMQLLFVPLLVVMLLLNIPSWFYLLGFILLAAIYWSTYRSQVPLYLSSRKVWAALENLLPQDRPFNFVDIGTGLGGVLAHLAQVRPDGQFVGAENAPLPFLLAWLRLRRYSSCKVLRDDFWQMNFGDFDVIYAYLSPVPMLQLWEKAGREMRPGSVLISNTFEIPGQAPDQVIELGDFHHSRLLVWRIT